MGVHWVTVATTWLLQWVDDITYAAAVILLTTYCHLALIWYLHLAMLLTNDLITHAPLAIALHSASITNSCRFAHLTWTSYLFTSPKWHFTEIPSPLKNHPTTKLKDLDFLRSM